MTILEAANASDYRYLAPERIGSLSVVLLARNAATDIRTSVLEALETASMMADRYEVVVVVEGSADGAVAAVRQLAETRYESIHVTKVRPGSSYGELVRRSWSAGRSEWVLFIDDAADVNVRDAVAFTRFTDSAQIISGYRTNLQGSPLGRARTRLLRTASRFSFRTGVRDALSPVKLIRSSVIRRLDLTADTAMIYTELCYEGRLHDWTVVEVPIATRRHAQEARSQPRPESGAFGELLAMRARFNRPSAQRLKFHTWLVGMLALVAGLAATVWAVSTHTVLAYGDAEAHLNISKRVVSGLTSGLAQLGSVWLPLPHLLMAPFVINDDMWRTGLAGAAVGVPALVLASVMVFRTAHLLTGSIAASWLAPLVVIANPNALYLAATPMTELLLLAMCAASVYFLCKWVIHDGTNNLVLTAVFASLATLSRYDGWMLVAIEAVVVVVIAALRHRRRGSIEGLAVLFGVLALTGVAGWLLWNQIIFSDALYFAQSVYGSAEQQQFFLRTGLLPTYHDAIKSVLYWLEDVRIVVGLPLMLAGAVGFVYLVVTSIRRRRIGPVLVAVTSLSCFAFYILSLYLGQASLILPRFAPPDAPYRMSNIRYGLQALLPIGILVAYLAARRPRILVPLLLVMVAAQAVFFVRTDQVMSYQDGTQGLSSQRVSKGPDSPVVEAWLKANYDGGLVLMDDYRRPVGPVETGIPMNAFIGVGNKPFWQDSLGNPARHAQWVVLQQAQTDAVWTGFGPQSRNILADHFVQVFRAGDVRVYKRRPDVADTVVKLGQHLYLDGKRWNSVGVNSYDLLEQTPAAIDTRLTDIAASGFNTVRTWCFDHDGGLSDATLNRLAEALNGARVRGVRVVCTLGNAHSDFGGEGYFTPQGQDFFGSEEARTRYQDQVRRLLNFRDGNGVRIGDQQAILAWDLLNEPRTNPSTPHGGVAQWTEVMGAFVGHLDQRHLITVGSEGFTSDYPHDTSLLGLPGAEFEALCGVPTITLCTAHLYPKYLGDPSSSENIGAVVQNWRAASEQVGKPCFLGEVGYAFNDAGSFDVRQAFYDNVARALNNSDLDGGLLWNFGDQVDDYFTLQYGDPDSDRTLSAWSTIVDKTK